MENTVIKLKTGLGLALAAALGLTPSLSTAFDSGSTGADGAFNPLVNTALQLPPDGVFNYTTVNIPAGVTLTFLKNATNTPVTILTTGDATIDGTITLSAGHSAHVGAAGDGNIGDDGLPGLGGPGGFDGGRGGELGPNSGNNRRGGEGLGPGGGGGASRNNSYGCGGGGGGYATGGGVGYSCGSRGSAGPAYGVAAVLPLIGGSGGGGGSAGDLFMGSGGGGGGGALLIAASGTVSINGAILAAGGSSGAFGGISYGGSGGGGSGGAIRILATTIVGNGPISAGHGGTAAGGSRAGGTGATGRIRLEAETMLRTATTVPVYTFSAPQDVFVAGLPSLRITSVAGVAAPAAPTGSADIVFPETTPNPVSVDFSTTGVPVGNTITLKLTPANGAPVTSFSTALVGTEAAATANTTITLPDGPSTLSASVSFTVVASVGNAMRHYAQGEQVEKVKIAMNGGQSTTTFITVSGKEHSWPSNAVAMR